MCLCVRVRARARARVACVRACGRAGGRLGVDLRACACTHGWWRVFVCAFVLTQGGSNTVEASPAPFMCLRTCIRTCLHTCLYIYLYTCLHTMSTHNVYTQCLYTMSIHNVYTHTSSTTSSAERCFIYLSTQLSRHMSTHMSTHMSIHTRELNNRQDREVLDADRAVLATVT